MAVTGTLALKAFNLSSFRRTSVRAAAAAETPAISFPVQSKTLYHTLQVKETASRDEIRMAYRSLAKREHPDVKSDCSKGFEEFVEIRRAYETLSDPAARKRYDLSIGKRIESFDFNRAGAGFGGFGYGYGRWETDQCW